VADWKSQIIELIERNKRYPLSAPRDEERVVQVFFSLDLTVARQWLRDGLAIANATNASYSVIATDSGRTVGCKVSVTSKYGVAYLTASLPVLA